MFKSQFCSRTHFFQSFMLSQVELVCSTLHQNWTMFWLALPTVAWGPAIVQLSVRFQNLTFQKIISHYHSRIFNSRITCPTAGQQPCKTIKAGFNHVFTILISQNYDLQGFQRRHAPFLCSLMSSECNRIRMCKVGGPKEKKISVSPLGFDFGFEI